MVEIFGHYQLIEKIAEGGMAEIYLARDLSIKSNENIVVIKRILKKFDDSERLSNLFMNEAKINMNMLHQSIISVSDFGLINNRFFMTMNFVEGLNLHQLLKKIKDLYLEKPNYNDFVYIIAEAAKALHYAHNCKDINTNKKLNIVHKDISPDNIMLNLDGKVKVIDFGIASLKENEKSNGKDGKFSYMSPEQAKGKKLDNKTDIFSLGSVLWEFLAERKLYKCRTVEEVKEFARRASIPDLKKIKPNLPTKLISIVNKCLEKNPENRYTDMKELYKELSSFLQKSSPDYNLRKMKILVKTCYYEQNIYYSSLIEQTKNLDESNIIDFNKRRQEQLGLEKSYGLTNVKTQIVTNTIDLEERKKLVNRITEFKDLNKKKDPKEA